MSSFYSRMRTPAWAEENNRMRKVRYAGASAPGDLFYPAPAGEYDKASSVSLEAAI